MTKSIPAWALNHLKENLPADVAVLNVGLHRRGVVVANTRLGAVVLTKTPWGEPTMTHLANPRERVSLQCVVCQELLEFRRLDLPTLVHCGICGSKYALDTAGIAEIRERAAWHGTGAGTGTGTQPSPKAPVVVDPTTPFTYDGYTLHSRDVEFKNGARRVIYFFAKQRPKSGSPIAKPAGYHVGVNQRTGLPFLKKGDALDGEDLTPQVEAAYRPQCAALTEVGHQCRNSARGTSKYCASHFGYQPPTIAKAAAAREDTRPRVPEAKDTVPSVRRRAA